MTIDHRIDHGETAERHAAKHNLRCGQGKLARLARIPANG
jgi:hypothetical protein